MCLAGRDAVVSMPTYNVSRGAYRVETPDPDDELYASGVGVHDDPEMIARVAATKKYRRDMEKRRLELKEDGKREWEVLADPDTGDAYYWNHISQLRKNDMPQSLDHFGDLQRLESFVINAGKDAKALQIFFNQFLNFFIFSFFSFSFLQQVIYKLCLNPCFHVAIPYKK